MYCHISFHSSLVVNNYLPSFTMEEFFMHIISHDVICTVKLNRAHGKPYRFYLLHAKIIYTLLEIPSCNYT